MDGIKGKIKFNKDKKVLIFPSNYQKFKSLLKETYNIAEDLLHDYSLSYIDEENDIINVQSEEDYILFYNIAKNKKDSLITMNIEEISKNKEKKEEININEIKNNNKEKKNSKSLELSDEILPGFCDNKDRNLLSKEKNYNKEINKEEDKKGIIQNNNINEIQINNINQSQERKEDQNKKNNSSISQNSGIALQNNRNNQIPQGQNNINLNNHNIMINQIQNQNERSQFVICFPLVCELCGRRPLYKTLYYCNQCSGNIVFCPQCEEKIGSSHEHPYYKVQNERQYKNLGLDGQSKIEKWVDNMGNTMENAWNSVISFFGGRGGNNQNQNNQTNYNLNDLNSLNNLDFPNNNQSNNNNQRVVQNNNQNEQRQQPLMPSFVNREQVNRQENKEKMNQWIRMARQSFELSSFNDHQIGEALKKANFNWDVFLVEITNFLQ